MRAIVILTKSHGAHFSLFSKSACGWNIEEDKDMMKRVLSLATILALVLALACGCGAKEKPAPEEDTKAPVAEQEESAEQKFVGILFPSAMVDRWPAEAEFLKADLEAMGYKAEIQYADENANTQYQQAENFITQGADMLVVCAVDTVAAKQIVESAQSEDVAVFSYCRLIEDITYDGYVAEDNNAVGLMQGSYIAENVESGNIIILGGAPTDSNGILYREKGVEAIQAKIDSGDYTVIADQYCDGWSPEVAMKAVENALTQNNNDVVAIMCPNDGLAGGAIEALAAQNLAGKVVVTGGDGELAAMKRISEGTQTMTILKPSARIAGAAAEAIDAFLSGNTPAWTGSVNNGAGEINAALVDMITITADNLQTEIIDAGIFTEAEING